MTSSAESDCGTYLKQDYKRLDDGKGVSFNKR